MSIAAIIRELPRLTVTERSILLRRLRELEEKDGLHFLNEAADAMFQEMDKEEAKHARRKSR